MNWNRYTDLTTPTGTLTTGGGETYPGETNLTNTSPIVLPDAREASDVVSIDVGGDSADVAVTGWPQIEGYRRITLSGEQSYHLVPGEDQWYVLSDRREAGPAEKYANIYFLDGGVKEIRQYSIGGPADLGAKIETHTMGYEKKERARAIAWDDTGTRFYRPLDDTYYADDWFAQYSCSRPYDLSTASLDSKLQLPNNDYAIVSSILFEPDGETLWIGDNGNNNWYEYTLSTAWDTTGLEFGDETEHTGLTVSPFGGASFNNDGTIAYGFNEIQDGYFREYHLNTPFDPTDVSETGSNLWDGTNWGQGAWSLDGTYLHISGSLSDGSFPAQSGYVTYELSTPFDLSSATKIRQEKIIDSSGRYVPAISFDVYPWYNY